MARPTAMKLALILFTFLLCVGCGGGSTPAATPSSSWAGTWSGRVDWVSPLSPTSNPASGDDVTITITPNKNCNIPCHSFDIAGTDVGPIFGNLPLGGGLIVYDNVTPNFATPGLNAAITNGDFTLNGNTITVT